MAYVSTWRRDGTGAELGGAWRPGVYSAELCVISGCANPVGAVGDACPDCRGAYGGAVTFGEEAAGAECWLCGTRGVVVDAACPTCSDTVLNPGVLVAGGRASVARRTG